MDNTTLSPCRPIIVLGVHRSGTSLVSDLIVQWGAFPGDLSLHPPTNQHNPRGFFEYGPLIDLMMELAETAPSWPMSREFEEHLRNQAYVASFREKALQLVAGMETQGSPWVWKEPNLPPYLLFWQRIWKAPIYVVTVRNPYDSGKSFEKMFLRPELRGKIRLLANFCLLWQGTLLTILERMDDQPAVLYVPYEELLRHPAEHCERLCDFLDLHTGSTSGREERLRPMIEAVDPALWRNRSSESFFNAPEVSEEQKELYRFLQRKTEGRAEPFDPARFPMPPGSEEYLENFQVFKSLMLEETARQRR